MENNVNKALVHIKEVIKNIEEYCFMVCERCGEEEEINYNNILSNARSAKKALEELVGDSGLSDHAKEKLRQHNSMEWQIRVNGKPVYYPQYITHSALEKYSQLCTENPSSYVDIARVDTTILFSQAEYRNFERHFEQKREQE